MTLKSTWRGWLKGLFPAIVLTLSVGFSLASRAFAGNQAPTGAARQRQASQRYGTSLDARVSQFAKKLDLNAAQRAAVKQILEQRQQEILRLRRDDSLSGGARIDRFRALQEKTVERIRGVLNEEQKQKYNPLAPRMIPPTQQQPSVEDWIKATTPH